MKRIFKTLAVFLSAIILLTGCSNDDDELIKETKIESVNNGREIEAFFNSEWADYNAADSYPETFFNRELMDKENICLVNSKEEFKNIYFGNKEIPEMAAFFLNAVIHPADLLRLLLHIRKLL